MKVVTMSRHIDRKERRLIADLDVETWLGIHNPCVDILRSHKLANCENLPMAGSNRDLTLNCSGLSCILYKSDG